MLNKNFFVSYFFSNILSSPKEKEGIQRQVECSFWYLSTKSWRQDQNFGYLELALFGMWELASARSFSQPLSLHSVRLVLIPEGSCLTLRFLPTPSLTLVQREVPDGVVRLSLVIQICQLLKCHPSWEIEFHQVLLVRFLTIGVEKDDCLLIICLLTKISINLLSHLLI